jgi:osmotically inducible protein OsmC
MELHRSGSAIWSGDLQEGQGAISTQSGALSKYPYSLVSRVKGQRGTNPEELLAAAHAGCFTMGVVTLLGERGWTADEIDTRANVTLQQILEGYVIPAVHLSIKAKVPGADDAAFQAIAAQAKERCPVSKLFRATITLDAELLDG